MRSYALFLALAVLHARAATIPEPGTEKKIPIKTDALDDVSLDNNESEQELVNPTDPVKDVENNLRNSIPENVPVKIVEEQPIIKRIPLTENSNDYVPDNDDSTNIKRVEIDLKNPGPPQRQEHDSQQPAAYLSYIDKERAVAAIKQSIAESQNIFTRGIQDVTQKFRYYFTNNDELDEVSKNIQSLRQNFDAEVVKLSNTINSYLKPERVESEGAEKPEIPSNVKEVENRLKNLEKNFDYGVGMLSEGVELLSILKEEDDQNLKIAGKADNENVATAAGTSPGTAVNPAGGANPTTPTASNPVFEYLQNLNNSIVSAFNNLGNTIQNYFNNQNQQQNAPSNSTNQGGFNPASFFQGINFPNIFQANQNTNPQPQSGSPPSSAQADDAGSADRPNILQQLSSSFQNFVNPGQAGQAQQNPITQFFSGVNQGITNLFQGRPQQTPQQNNQVAVASSQPAEGTPVAAQGTNSVPVAAAQVEPAKPAKESEPVVTAPVQADPAPSVPAQSGPIQQMVQNNPIVKGITNAVQKIQGMSNPSKPRETVMESSDSKGHGGSNTGDSIGGVDGIKDAAVKEPEIISENQDGSETSAEPNKTE